MAKAISQRLLLQSLKVIYLLEKTRILVVSKSHFDLFPMKDSNSHLFTDLADLATEFRDLGSRNSSYVILEFAFPETRNPAHGFGLPPFHTRLPTRDTDLSHNFHRATRSRDVTMRFCDTTTLSFQLRLFFEILLALFIGEHFVRTARVHVTGVHLCLCAEGRLLSPRCPPLCGLTLFTCFLP